MLPGTEALSKLMAYGKRRNVAAKSMASPVYRKRVKPSGKRYSRKKAS